MKGKKQGTFKKNLFLSLGKNFKYKKKKHQKGRHKKITLADFIEKDNSESKRAIVLKVSLKENYAKFLKSDYWIEVRDKVIERDDNTCQKCGSKTNLHVHHKTYKNHFKKHLNLQDLITLCKKCHEKEHEK